MSAAAFVLLVIIAVVLVLIHRELKHANVLAQQAITQRLAIAEILSKRRREAGE